MYLDQEEDKFIDLLDLQEYLLSKKLDDLLCLVDFFFSIYKEDKIKTMPSCKRRYDKGYIERLLRFVEKYQDEEKYKRSTQGKIFWLISSLSKLHIMLETSLENDGEVDEGHLCGITLTPMKVKDKE